VRMDEKKPAIPEESRLLKNHLINDGDRGEVSVTPLVFSVGGSASPDTRHFARSVSQAYGEASILEEEFAAKSYAKSMAISISSKIMRACARRIIKSRAILVLGKPRSFTPNPPDPINASLADTPHNWISPYRALYSSTLAEVPVKRVIRPPKKRGIYGVGGRVVAHYTPPPKPQTTPAPPRRSASSSLSREDGGTQGLESERERERVGESVSSCDMDEDGFCSKHRNQALTNGKWYCNGPLPTSPISSQVPP
jgi:hypothetical protein